MNSSPIRSAGRSGGSGGAVSPSQSANRPSRITTPASRALYASSRAGSSGGGGSIVASRGGSGGGGGISSHHGGSAGGGGYGVWRQPYQSHHINHNFYHSPHYAYRPTVWGSRPWWGSSYSHSWHHGSWNYGWNSSWNRRYAYYHRPVSFYPPGYRTYYTRPATLIPWGLASWSLGRLAYDTGYYSYHNPYVAPPVHTHTTVIRYSEPITVVASRAEPISEELAQTASEKSSAAMDRSRNAFAAGDYLSAASAVDEAISHAPGDPVLHEFRALTLFALGRYGDAAGVLHSVLASGPGWGWETLIGFYSNPDHYTEQLRRLEDYVVAHGEAPEPHFLLGYHYLVGENLPEAHAMFDRVVTLQPGDTVSTQLRSLLADSAPEATVASEDAPLPEPVVPIEPDKAPIAEESLHGIWKALSAEGKTVTLSLTAIGTFSWEYEGASAEVLKGEWSLDKDGLLVLADEDVQMVGDITLNENGSLHFLLAGSPEGDPGLKFERQ